MANELTYRFYRAGTLVATKTGSRATEHTFNDISTTGWSAGTYAMTVTKQDDTAGETESDPASYGNLTVQANVLSIVSYASATHKSWNTTRSSLTLPQLVLTGSQKAALILSWEDEVAAPTVSFTGLGFTPTLKTARPATPSCQIDIFWANPGAGTYNGSVTLSGTGNCTFDATWVVFSGGSVPAGTQTGVDVGGGTNTQPTMGITTTGTGSIVIGAVNYAQTNSVAAVPNSVAAGDTDDCTALLNQYNPGAAVHLRINGTVNAGSHNIGVRTPVASNWTVGCLEVLNA